MTFGSTIAQSVVEEKSTRVIEILLAAIPTRALLAGKILGTSILAYAQIVLLVAVTLHRRSASPARRDLLPGLSAPVGWFAVFFVVRLRAARVAVRRDRRLVSRQEDIGSTTTPVTMLVMLPYFLVIFFNNNELVLAIMSYVPFSAPIAMPLRLFLGDGAVVGAVRLARDPDRHDARGDRPRRAHLRERAAQARLAGALAGGAGPQVTENGAVTTLHDPNYRGFASDNYAGVHPEVLAAVAGGQ